MKGVDVGVIVIKFSVYNQRLRRITSGIIPSNAYGKLKFEFDFRTDDWDAVEIKTANFYYKGENYSINLDDNNQCFVPKEVINLPSFSVSVHGGDIVTNYVQNLVEKIKSNSGIIPPSDNNCDCGPSMVYVPTIDKHKILSWKVQEVADDMPEIPSTDLNPYDEWSQTGNEVESQYVWEPMQ